MGLLISSLLTAGGSLALFANQSSRPAEASGIDQPYETELMQLINQQRQIAGKAALRFDSRLAVAADNHNALMNQAQYFDHQVPGEPDLYTRILQAGYSPLYAWGEILEINGADPAEAMAVWMGSPGHRDVIVNSIYTDVGCGYLSSTWARLWTCDFAMGSGVTIIGSGSSATSTASPTRTSIPTSTPAPTRTNTPTSIPTLTGTPLPTRAKVTATSTSTVFVQATPTAASSTHTNNGRKSNGF
jgi:uncharacterized protein YkwD